ncbi:MAG: DMT family transporter [Sporolactobacillus sp.]|jgi:drug/metabolite transporter (DMT)-like permease|nr:DMT family transporter [Sporolactobacillus sp.]
MNAAALIKMTLAMTIFGSIGLFSKLSGLPSIELVFVRCCSATVFLAAYWLLSGHYKQEVRVKKETPAIIFGGICLVLNWLFFFAAFAETAITVAISIYNLAPILVLMMGWFFFHERTKWLGVLAVGVAFVGTSLIAGVGSGTPADGRSALGPLLALAAAVFYALVIITGKYVQKTSPYLVTVVQTAIGVVILLPFVHFSFYTQLCAANWFFSIFTGVVHTGIVYLLFYDSIRSLPTPIISALTYLDPLVAILLDVAVLGFVPSALQVLGIVLIFTAVSYTMMPKHAGHDTDTR